MKKKRVNLLSNFIIRLNENASLVPNVKGKAQERMNRQPHSTSKLRFEVNDVKPLCTVIDATTKE